MIGEISYLNELLDIFGIEMDKERNEIDHFLKVNPLLKNHENIHIKVQNFLRKRKPNNSEYTTYCEK